MDIDRLFDGQTVDVPCPGCGHSRPLSVTELKADPKFTCDGCGQEVQIDSSQFREGLDGVEHQIEKLRDTVRRLGGDLDIE